MILPVASTDVPLVIGIRLPAGAAIWAEVLGVLFAWLRLRGTESWKNRPDGVRRLDLLAGFVGKITVLSALLGLAIAASALVAGNING
jgi:hypothetical protein